MEFQTSTNTVNPATFSRYRSVRRNVTQDVSSPPPVPQATYDQQQIRHDRQHSQNLQSRAPSRYRKVAPSNTHYEALPTPSAQITEPQTVTATIPAAPSRYVRSRPDHVQPSAQQNPSRSATRQTRRPEGPQAIPVTPECHAPSNRRRSRTASSPQDRVLEFRRSYDAAREEARCLLEGEHDRLRRMKERQLQEKESKRRAETMEKARQQELETAQTTASTGNPDTPAASPPVETKSRLRKWTIGGTSEKSDKPNSSPGPQHTSPAQQIPSRAPTRIGTVQRHQADPSLPPVTNQAPITKTRPNEKPSSPPIFALNPGNGPPKSAIPAQTQLASTDAPVSAVNAGERRVEIRYAGSRITLPVTPSTSSKDLLNSASVIMSQPIDPRTSVLVETYSPLGLERPLRKYERVRDVMNSWDTETQNYLTVVSDSSCTAIHIDQKDTPVNAPKVNVFMYHSQRPGKWEKHFVTLRADGQLTASKKENDIDAVNALHLSDFDIFTPAKKQLRSLKAPKKHVFAIKSQQKSIMFESTENFVHFFSTSDPALAEQFYNAIQGWRSWYLVNVLGESTTAKAPPPTNALEAKGMDPKGGHMKRPSTAHSTNSIPYQLGTFADTFNFSADNFKYGDGLTDTGFTTSQTSPAKPDSKSTTLPTRSRTLIGHAHTASNAHSQAHNQAKTTHTSPNRNGSIVQNHSHTPAPSSSTPASHPLITLDQPFSSTGLLGNTYNIRKAATEAQLAHATDPDAAFTGTGLISDSTAQKLTNPNSSNVNRFSTSAAFTGTGMLANTLPSSLSQSQPLPMARNGTVKKHPHYNEGNGITSTNQDDAIIPNGLLARALTKKRSKANTNNMNGNGNGKSGEPLVDLSGHSEFADGSLLRKVEAYNQQFGPVVDRSRGTEVVVRNGEGL